MNPWNQEEGVTGRYWGLPDEFAQASKAKIVILPVPFDQTTTYKHGTDQGPAALIEASRHLELYEIETASVLYPLGVFTAPPIQTTSHEMLNQQLYQQVSHYLARQQFVVTLGGEHSISYGAIQAHAEHYPHLSVLQFDAHADLYDSYANNRWNHACIMARVREIPQIANSVSVGIRSLSEEEAQVIDKSSTFFAFDLDPQDQWIDKVMSQLNPNVYISFDVDALDPSIMPSTGTPEPGGLQWNQALALLKRVAQEREIVGLDVVELSPLPSQHAPDFLAAKLVSKILNYQFFKTNFLKKDL